MVTFQIDHFWEDISQIQQRHSLFFPFYQLKYISLEEKDSIHGFISLEGYNLATAITQQLQLAFKLASEIHFSDFIMQILNSLGQSLIICLNCRNRLI